MSAANGHYQLLGHRLTHHLTSIRWMAASLEIVVNCTILKTKPCVHIQQHNGTLYLSELPCQAPVRSQASPKSPTSWHRPASERSIHILCKQTSSNIGHQHRHFTCRTDYRPSYIGYGFTKLTAWHTNFLPVPNFDDVTAHCGTAVEYTSKCSTWITAPPITMRPSTSPRHARSHICTSFVQFFSPSWALTRADVPTSESSVKRNIPTRPDLIWLLIRLSARSGHHGVQ